MSECFLHLYGEEFLDALIAEENLLEGKILLKSHLVSCSRLETYQCDDKELLVFWGLTISMKLIIKKKAWKFSGIPKTDPRSPPALFWSSFYYSLSQRHFTLMMLQLMLYFPKNEGDSRKLKKGNELVQHLTEQCRHYYVPKQYATYKHWWKFDMYYEEDRGKGRRKTLVCSSLK